MVCVGGDGVEGNSDGADRVSRFEKRCWTLLVRLRPGSTAFGSADCIFHQNVRYIQLTNRGVSRESEKLTRVHAKRVTFFSGSLGPAETYSLSKSAAKKNSVIHKLGRAKKQV